VQSIELLGVDMPLADVVQTPMTSVANVVTLLIRVRDRDGIEGWGEIWCNFPRFGLHHRARLLREVVLPLLVGREFASPPDCFVFLSNATRILSLQAGEPGPVSAVIAGIDIALWDIVAKKVQQPLWRLLGGERGDVAVYVSVGWAPDALDRVRRHAEQGVRAFKVRSRGDASAHLAAAVAARDVVGFDRELMMDLNSSWNEVAALEGLKTLAPARLSWLEEPVPADESADTWKRLAEAAPMPLAGGENVLGSEAMHAALELGALRVLQPDMTKWGGFSGVLPLSHAIVEAGRRFCPHMFGGAVGTLASAHLLAASNAPAGILEWGVNHNPVRDALMNRDLPGGSFVLDEVPGLGVRPDDDTLRKYRIDV
jgi:L-alanine-DL-glutamate epimerase-like enolase superfamily enzyme